MPINRTIEYIQMAQSFVDFSSPRLLAFKQTHRARLNRLLVSLSSVFFSFLMFKHEIIINISLTHQYKTIPTRSFLQLKVFFPIKQTASQKKNRHQQFLPSNWISNGAIIVERTKCNTCVLIWMTKMWIIESVECWSCVGEHSELPLLADS